MSSAFSTLQMTTEDGVLGITLNRPESYNAYNEVMSVELATAFKTAGRDDGIRAVVLTGAGKAFCSGQDLQEIKGRYSGDKPAQPLDFASHLRAKFNPLVSRIRSLEKPVIAALNGGAAGAGASFALACDLRICARSAYFMMAFVHVGLIPDSAATMTLVQHCGLGRASELCFLGEKLSAEEALRYGLANRVVDDEQLMPTTMEMARKLAAMPTRAIGLTKRALQKAWTATVDDQLEYEALMQQTAGNTADHREGVLAFVEKRKPKFTGA